MKDFISQQTKISEQDWLYFSSKFVREKYSKKTILLKKGETENFLYFLEDGIVRFYIPNEEKETTFVFAFSGWFMSAYDSFITREPSIYNVECLTDAEVLKIKFEDLQLVYKNTEIGEKIGRLAAEQLF